MHENHIRDHHQSRCADGQFGIQLHGQLCRRLEWFRHHQRDRWQRPLRVCLDAERQHDRLGQQSRCGYLHRACDGCQQLRGLCLHRHHGTVCASNDRQFKRCALCRERDRTGECPGERWRRRIFVCLVTRRRDQRHPLQCVSRFVHGHYHRCERLYPKRNGNRRFSITDRTILQRDPGQL